MSLEWKYEKLGKLCSFDKEGVNPKEDIKYYHYSFPAFDNNKEPEVEVGKDIKSSHIIPQELILDPLEEEMILIMRLCKSVYVAFKVRKRI